MKKMNSIIAFAAAAVAVVFSVSCQQEIQVPDKDADAIEEKTPNEGKLITITATIPDNPETRVAFAQDPGTVKLTWENGDKIIIVDEADLMHPQTFELTSGDGEATATFTGTEPSTGSSYIIYYGGNTNPGRDEYDTTDEVVNKDYSGQTQTGNQNLSHLRFTAMLTGVNAFDHFVFSQEWATAHGGSLVINGIYKFYLQMPNDVADVTEVRLNAPSAVFYTTNAPGGRTSEIGVTLNSVNISASHILTAYAMASAQTVSMAADETYTVTVVGDDYSWVKQFTTAGAKSLGGSGTHVIQLNNDSWTKIGGKGTDAAPFLMDDPGELLLIHPLLVVNGAKRYFKLDGNVTYDSSSSTAFNTAGGLGELFNAEFDGNIDGGFAIKNLSASVPIFSNVASSAIVKNLELDSACSLTVASDQRGYFAPVVGWTEGSITNVVSHANVSFQNVYSGTAANSENCGKLYVGGLVSYCKAATISGCSADGTLLCPASGSYSEFVGYVGGICAAAQSNATIEDCSFGGDIKISNGDFGESDYGELTITSSEDYRTFHIGGIIGYISSGKIDRCSTAASKVIDIRGSFKVQLGGIVGHTNTSGCTVTGTESNNTINRASVSYKTAAERKTGPSPLYIGGILGYGGGTIERTTNYGAVDTKCRCTSVYIGGLAGYFGGTVSNCTNETTGTVTRTNYSSGAQENRYIVMSGGVASLSANTTFNHVVNKAQVLSNAVSTSYMLTIQMGGIMGGIMNDNTAYTCSFSNCENSGLIKVYDASNSTSLTLSALGGIMGANRATSTFTDCTNTGEICCYYSVKDKNGKRPSFVGGIAGFLGNQTITNNDSESWNDITAIAGISGLSFLRCHNTGRINNQNFNNTITAFLGTHQGGIVGAVHGTDGSKASFSYCDSKNTDSKQIYTYRGCGGGIAGYASNATLSNCEVSQQMAANANATSNSGLVGQMVATSAEDCTVSSAIGGAGSTAGFAYTMDATSSISSSNVNGVVITSGATAMAVFVNTTASGASITDCGAKGTIGGDAITAGSTFINTANGVSVTPAIIP